MTGIKATLSNGEKSPYFQANETQRGPYNMKINQDMKIIKISARTTSTPYGIKFMYENRHELVEWSNESRYTTEHWTE